MKKLEHAISERGSTTNSVEVEQMPPQDSVNEIGTLQEVSSSASEETHQSESENFVSKDENNVIKPVCRKCKDRFIILEKLNARYEEREKDNKRIMERSVEINKNLEVINEKQEAFIQAKQQQIEDLLKSQKEELEAKMRITETCKGLSNDKIRFIKRLQQKEQQIDDLQTRFEKKDETIRDLSDQLDVKQKLVEELQQKDICSKELIEKLETLENDMSKSQKLEEKSKIDKDVIMKLENKNKQLERDMCELVDKLEEAKQQFKEMQ